MKRVLVVTVVLLLVVVGGGLAAGGWYYTGEMLPAPVPGEPDYEVEVVAADEQAGTVTLAGTDGDVADHARLGFWTADGALDLGAVTATDASGTTREATLLDGVWPQAGDLGAPRVVTFRGDPLEGLGLDYDDVAIDGPTGPLPAWLVAPDADADTVADGTYAVLVHGRGADRGDMHRELRTTVAAGLPTLVVSVRNDPDAVADPDGWGRYGHAEWADLQAAIDHLVDVEGAEQLVAVGASQGGAIVLTWLRRGEHTERTAGVVLVSPLVRLQGTLELQAANRGIPDPLIGPLLWATGRLVSLRADLDVAALDQTTDEALATFADVPMLVTHGTGDTTVPFADTATFAEALGDTVTFSVYDDVEHVREWNADPDRFDGELRTFLDQVLG